MWADSDMYWYIVVMQACLEHRGDLSEFRCLGMSRYGNLEITQAQCLGVLHVDCP